MDRINRKIVEDKTNRNRLVVVTWYDPYDDSDEVSIGDIKVKREVYRTPGYLMGVHNDHVVIGSNQEYLECKERPTGTYKGSGRIPVSLIINVEIMDRNK